MSSPKIRTTSYRFPPSFPSAPTFGLQVTQLKDTYLLWVGVLPASAGDLPTVSDPMQEARLGRDWAVGMPGRGNLPPVGTQLLRSSGEDLALPLSQRLARRFKKQVFLSVDVGEVASGVGGAEGARILLDVERGLVGVLVGLEKQQT
ncbi:hypothetical protein CALCODRAFT_441821 [Calocera cornea HHB12733]|uniref:Uncharacterized protein n=1 Tax=Calocera cornea HHB12733 TaxID=1353952 RepID=A0A165D7V7_9BASI|nr:hypothetical protein CALCODRAFT_441821 [Calocera cornea HHB12733]